jgi:nucleotide-binding universal stress UspA family protein
MVTIKHILFPCDFSPQCRLAAPFVRAIAARFGASVTLLTVALEADGRTDIPEQPVQGDARLQSLLAQELAGVPVQSVRLVGDAALRMTAFAHDNAVDLIMMPTRGYGLVRSLLIGSVTAKVLHDAKCPVWTATHAEEQTQPKLPRTVLCAVDGTPKSVALLQWAAGFAKEAGSVLRLIHVTQPISDMLILPGERALQAQMNERARSQVEALARTAGVETTVDVAAGQVSEVVGQAAQQYNADLVMIGRGSLQSTLGRLRTHAYAIIRSSPCPVLSV